MKLKIYFILNFFSTLLKSKIKSREAEFEIKSEKIKIHRNIIGILFVLLMLICVFGYIKLPYTFSAASWPVEMLRECLELLSSKN